MKRLKWKLDTSFASEQEKAAAEKEDPKQLYLSFLNGALNSTYKDGLRKDFMIRLFKVTEKVEKAKTSYVDLEDAEFSLVEEAFEKSKFPAKFQKILAQIYASIDEAKERAKAESEGKGKKK